METPADDPYVTGVGGTSLVLDSNGNESSETVWNNLNSSPNYGAGGGGTSSATHTVRVNGKRVTEPLFATPSWQTGTGVPSGSTFRLVPDVAGPADVNYGGLVILNGSQAQYGGTSWSSPTWAGFCALINQYRANAGYSALGLLGPNIYPLIGTANFRDITSGNNYTNNSPTKYAATAGYDMCSGIGVPNVQTLAQTLTPASQQAPAFTDGPPPSTATVGTAYSFTYTASGSPAPTFSVTSGSLPTSLSLNSTTGVISGTPSVSGLFTGTVTASNGVGTATTQSFSITVDQSPAITNGPPPSIATVGTAYSFTYTASGSPAPTFSVTAGNLPTGLSLSTAGVISGTPTASGLFTGTVTASNGIGSAATQSFSITVDQAPAITDGPPPTSATVGTAYSFTYTASGYPAPTYSLTAGNLPTGLSLSSAGVISGTPSAAARSVGQ